MKKFMTFVAVAAVAGAVSTASAADRTGKFGIGWQETFSSNLNSGNTGAVNTLLGNWSLKYGISSALNAQLAVGFQVINKGGNDMLFVGGRITYDLMEKENSDFYLGLGFGDSIDKDNNVLRIQVPLGFEWSFAGLPEVGISAEAGFVWDYTLQGVKQSAFASVGGVAGGAFGLGIHYYF